MVEHTETQRTWTEGEGGYGRGGDNQSPLEEPGCKVTWFPGLGLLGLWLGCWWGGGRQREACFLLLGGKGRGLPVGGVEGHVFLFGVTTDALKARQLSLQACPNSNLGSDSLIDSMPHSLLQSNPTLDGKTRSLR